MYTVCTFHDPPAVRYIESTAPRDTFLAARVAHTGVFSLGISRVLKVTWKYAFVDINHVFLIVTVAPGALRFVSRLSFSAAVFDIRPDRIVIFAVTTYCVGLRFVCVALRLFDLRLAGICHHFRCAFRLFWSYSFLDWCSVEGPTLIPIFSSNVLICI